VIPQKTVEQIIHTARIEEVVSDFLNLKKRGVNKIGLCPFHNEKTPSFTVSPSKNIFKCFGCGKAGSPVKFLMEHEQYSYPEALRHLAAKYNIEIVERKLTDTEQEEVNFKESLFLVNQYASKHFEENLANSEEGQRLGATYFKERGFNEESIKKFSLGWADSSGNKLLKAATEAQYNPKLLNELGLVKNERDFFRSRIIFPIRNLSGKPVAFGARTLTNQGPKYLNSPETPIYHKSDFLYGLSESRNAIRKQERCLLVEGYTDVISLHQAGIENVVASSGTSLTENQIRLIHRYTSNLVILFDGDAAGIKAATRGVDLILKQDLDVKIVILPEALDPDSFVKQRSGRELVEYIQENGQDFILFKTGLIQEESKKDPLQKVQLLQDILESIAKIPNQIKRSVYLKECASLLEMSETVLTAELNKIIKKEVAQIRKQIAREDQTYNADLNEAVEELGADTELAELPLVAALTLEKRILSIIIQHGRETFNKETGQTVAHKALEVMLPFISIIRDSRTQHFYSYVAQLLNGDFPPLQSFLNHTDEDISTMAINLTTTPFRMSENWEKKYGKGLQTQADPDFNFVVELDQCLNLYLFRDLERLYQENNLEIKRYEELGDEAEIRGVLALQVRVIEERIRRAKSLNNTIIN